MSEASKGAITAEVAQATAPLRGTVSETTVRAVRSGATALLLFLDARKTTLGTLTLTDWRAFIDEVRSGGRGYARRLLMGARFYLRAKAATGAVSEAMAPILLKHVGQCKRLPEREQAFERECAGFRASLVGVIDNTRGIYERGARVFLAFLKTRGRPLRSVTKDDWAAFREATLEQTRRAEHGRPHDYGLVTGARTFLQWKADHGHIRKDQVFPVWRAPRSASPALPSGLASVPEHLQEALDIAGFAATTRLSYTRAVRDFLSYVAHEAQVHELSDVTRELVTAYRLHMQKATTKTGRAYSASTQTLVLAALRFLYSWLVKTGRVLNDPTQHLEYPKEVFRLPRPIKVGEIERLLRSVPKTPLGVRDRAILELLYGTGMRRAELCRLTLTDLNLEERQILIREGKGRKDRVVPVGRRAKEALALYLDSVRHRFLRRATQAVFLTRSGRPLAPNSLTVHVKALGKRIGLAVAPHVLRHSCATHLLRHHADIRHIQRLLGHGSLHTTERYTKVEVGDLKKILARCHPRERRGREAKQEKASR